VQLTDVGYLLGLGLKAGGQPARQPRMRPGSSRHHVTGEAADSAPDISATC